MTAMLVGAEMVTQCNTLPEDVMLFVASFKAPVILSDTEKGRDRRDLGDMNNRVGAALSCSIGCQILSVALHGFGFGCSAHFYVCCASDESLNIVAVIFVT